MFSVVPATVATLAPFVNVNSTDDAVPGLLLAVVPLAITTTTAVALAYVHDVAKVPLLGVPPTFTPHLQHESTVRLQHWATQHVANSNAVVATLRDRHMR